MLEHSMDLHPNRVAHIKYSYSSSLWGQIHQHWDKLFKQLNAKNPEAASDLAVHVRAHKSAQTVSSAFLGPVMASPVIREAAPQQPFFPDFVMQPDTDNQSAYIPARQATGQPRYGSRTAL